MKLICKCEQEHEEKFVCDFCLMRAEWFVKINNLFDDEFDEFDNQGQRRFITAVRLLGYLFQRIEQDCNNGYIDPLTLTKAGSKLEELRTILFVISLEEGM